VVICVRNTKDVRSGEKILFETKPRFFMYLKSAVIKFIALIVIIYIFEFVVSAAASIQNFIIRYVQVPLVEATTLILLFLMFIIILWIIWDILSSFRESISLLIFFLIKWLIS